MTVYVCRVVEWYVLVIYIICIHGINIYICVFNTIFASNTLFMALKFLYIYVYIFIYIKLDVANFHAFVIISLDFM